MGENMILVDTHTEELQFIGSGTRTLVYIS